MKLMTLLLSAGLACSALAQNSSGTTKKAEPKKADSVLGVEIGPPGRSIRACVPSDKSPAGAMLKGYKKEINSAGFGYACRWVKQQEQGK